MKFRGFGGAAALVNLPQRLADQTAAVSPSGNNLFRGHGKGAVTPDAFHASRFGRVQQVRAAASPLPVADQRVPNALALADGACASNAFELPSAFPGLAIAVALARTTVLGRFALSPAFRYNPCLSFLPPGD
jgi:hypothetical protein